MKNIDFGKYVDFQKPLIIRKVLTVDLLVDRKLILECLISDGIFISSFYYEVPEKQFLDCLINNKFGLLTFELTQLN